MGIFHLCLFQVVYLSNVSDLTVPEDCFFFFYLMWFWDLVDLDFVDTVTFPAQPSVKTFLYVVPVFVQLSLWQKLWTHLQNSFLEF